MKKLNNTTLIISILLFFSGNLAFTQTEENSNKEIELSFVVDSAAHFPGDKLAMGKFYNKIYAIRLKHKSPINKVE